MKNHLKTTPMDRLLKFLLVFSNLLLTLAFAWQWTRPPVSPVVHVAAQKTQTTPPVALPAPVVNVDLAPLADSLQRMQQEIAHLGKDVKMLNVTSIQFSHLGREIDQLEKTSLLVAERIKRVESLPAQSRKLEASKEIIRLKELGKKIDAQLLERRSFMKTIVEKLENNFVTTAPTKK